MSQEKIVDLSEWMDRRQGESRTFPVNLVDIFPVLDWLDKSSEGRRFYRLNDEYSNRLRSAFRDACRDKKDPREADLTLSRYDVDRIVWLVMHAPLLLREYVCIGGAVLHIDHEFVLAGDTPSKNVQEMREDLKHRIFEFFSEAAKT